MSTPTVLITLGLYSAAIGLLDLLGFIHLSAKQQLISAVLCLLLAGVYSFVLQ